MVNQHFVWITFVVCSGSTIVSVGDSEPPQFIYDDEEYQDIFVSGIVVN
jgi:4-diphosphocytidyl-2-C-methyl-D-erythritol kinase